ncbi:MAG: thioredoxin family protein [Armatimonadota bacterium]
MPKGFLRHAPGGPEAINSASFDDDISDTSRTYVIEFWSAGCAACERIAGVLEQTLAGANHVTIYTVNVDEEADLARRCGVRSLPAVLVFRNGVEVYRSHIANAEVDVARFVSGDE